MLLLIAALFFFNDTATTELYTLSLHDALPIYGRLLAEGAHVNAVGSYLPDQRELDTETVRRAKVVVETRGVALAEAGDLLIPIAERAIGPEHIVAHLAEVVRGAAVRPADHGVTVVESA